ncbi:hypothetical protein G6F36_016064 [Rhizopus arrhizus]|nr:hypothetical protein G6F36_016064 [Rhizopus arrhizus]
MKVPKTAALILVQDRALFQQALVFTQDRHGQQQVSGAVVDLDERWRAQESFFGPIGLLSDGTIITSHLARLFRPFPSRFLYVARQ